MKTTLIIDGNDVYEIDEDCMECKKKDGKGTKCTEEEKPKRKRGRNTGKP